ncbi:hypothetical protein F0L17_14465 [Streptomyces sp. TRM43335]|uniref:Phage portal protein n=1 Tax=Streptomyces taklimakanensis TaxID=2569853 RepID=A0A6G2BDG9_9ACTN|nr:hypothetical protein [Streptomyces taklimakanensis]
MTGRSLSAAAARYTARKGNKQRSNSNNGADWQARAWEMYNNVPEVRFAATWIGNAMAGARLYAGYRADDRTIQPAPDGHPAAEAVARIGGGPDGQAAMLGRFGKYLIVPGEGWIVVLPGEFEEQWHTLSTGEIRQQSGKLVAEIDGEQVEVPPHDPDSPYDDAPVAIRVWEPHPEKHMEADSPVRSSLQLLEELQLLNSAVAAIARSRLTGRGVLLVPKGTRFPTTPGSSDAEDDLIEVFMEVAETAIREPESAAATVPIILEVPGDAIGQIQRLTFESDFDELAIKLREEAIRRFATGLDFPAEILLGLGDVNHWGTWALTQEAIRLGVEPRLRTVAHAFTTQWLRPLLESQGVPDAERWLVWYDTSPLRVRANRSQTAIDLFKLEAISDTAVRRETGFDESDAPHATTATDADQEQEPSVTPTTRLPVDENPSEPNTLPAAAPSDALIAAVDGIVWAALSSAGEKLRKTPACPRSERARAREITAASLHSALPVEADQIDRWKLLDGVWVRVPEIAARYGLNADCLTSTLDNYTRELIAAGVEHDYKHVPAVVAPCLAGAA